VLSAEGVGGGDQVAGFRPGFKVFVGRLGHARMGAVLPPGCERRYPSADRQPRLTSDSLLPTADSARLFLDPLATHPRFFLDSFLDSHPSSFNTVPSCPILPSKSPVVTS
jgi:hypothetical protein